MSLNWNFNKPAGYIQTPEGRTVTLYTGNAQLIMLDEYPDQYNLVSFWADAQHMKNCLGLAKGYNNIYTDWNGSKWVFYKENCRNLYKMVEAIVRAFDAVTVQVLPTAPQEVTHDEA